MNSIHNSAHRILIKEDSGIDLNLRKDSEKDSAILEIYAVSPSVKCSPDIGRFNVEDTMKFSIDMWQRPHSMSASNKKNLKRTEEIHDLRAASDVERKMDLFLDKRDPDPEFIGEK